MVTEAMKLCGLGLGPDSELIQPSYSNEAGYWEDQRFVQLNEAVLAASGGAWDRLPTFPPSNGRAWTKKGGLGLLVGQGKELIASLPTGRTRGWKDPRNSLILPFWLRAEPSLKVIACVRNPLEVALSLQRVGAVKSNAEGLALWQQYNARLMRDAARERRILTHFGRYFSDPTEEVARVAEFAQLEISEAVVSNGLSAIRPDMRHSRFWDCDLADFGADDELIDLYRRMCEEAEWQLQTCPRHQPSSTDEVDRLFDRLEDAHAQIYELQGQMAGGPDDYRRQLGRIREIVRSEIPRDADIAVIGGGDPQLLMLYGRTAHNLTQGQPPGSGIGCMALLEYARSCGATFLLVPATELWWLDQYRAFDRHLRQRYSLVFDDEDVCLIFDLRESTTESAQFAWRELNHALASADRRDSERVILDWNSGVDLALRLPDLRIFSPLGVGDALPYLDGTVDVVAIGAESTSARQKEARRVATTAVISCDRDEPRAVEWKAKPRPYLPTFSLIVADTIAPAPGSTIRATVRQGLDGEILIARSAATSLVKAWNATAAVATGEVLVFIHPHALVLDGWLEALLRTFVAYSDAGAVAAKLLYPDGRLHHAGGVVSSDLTLADVGDGEANPVAPAYTFVRSVDFCSPALFGTRRSTFTAAGGLADRYVAVGPHLMADYCLRIRKGGCATYFQPESVGVFPATQSAGDEEAQAQFARTWQRKLKPVRSAR